MNNTKEKITVETIVEESMEKVWNAWTQPSHIMLWNNASPDWFTPKAENDLTIGGKFNYRMEAKDGSFGFDFWGIYDKIIPNELISYTTGDDRWVQIEFSSVENGIKIIESFEAESENSIELQKKGWQLILDNFKKYTESI